MQDTPEACTRDSLSELAIRIGRPATGSAWPPSRCVLMQQRCQSRFPVTPLVSVTRSSPGVQTRSATPFSVRLRTFLRLILFYAFKLVPIAEAYMNRVVFVLVLVFA